MQNTCEKETEPRSAVRVVGYWLAVAACAATTLLSGPKARAQTLFVSDGNGDVYKVTPGGLLTTFASGMDSPFGLAFDGAGNLFVGDNLGGAIYKITPDGTRSTFATGVIDPTGMAFDGAGNLFVASYADAGHSGTIYEFAPDGTRSTFATGLGGPVGLAFNSEGDLFVGDFSSSIYEFAPDGAKTTFATGLSIPYGLAFDSKGNLFEADRQSGTIYEFAPDGTPSIFSGAYGPAGLAFDNADNLFVVDYNGGSIDEIAPDGSRRTVIGGIYATFIAVEPIPEPSTFGLMAMSAALLLARRKGMVEFFPRLRRKPVCLDQLCDALSVRRNVFGWQIAVRESDAQHDGIDKTPEG